MCSCVISSVQCTDLCSCVGLYIAIYTHGLSHHDVHVNVL